MESGVPICNTCGQQVGISKNGEVFVACHECNFPICKACVEFELKEGRKGCLRCGSPYDGKCPLSLSLCFSFFFFCVEFVVSESLFDCCSKKRNRIQTRFPYKITFSRMFIHILFLFLPYQIMPIYVMSCIHLLRLDFCFCCRSPINVVEHHRAYFSFLSSRFSHDGTLSIIT